RFRRVDHREAVLIRGQEGWGEFSPFPDYPPHVTTRWLAAAPEAGCSRLPTPGRSSILVNVTVPAVAPEVAVRLVRESGAGTAKVKVGEPGQTAEEDEEGVAAGGEGRPEASTHRAPGRRRVGQTPPRSGGGGRDGGGGHPGGEGPAPGRCLADHRHRNSRRNPDSCLVGAGDLGRHLLGASRRPPPTPSALCLRAGHRV